ncbi:hypothetical protein P8C59_000208 [Phyllachora maydis]|uniref:Uncharacterized protein n=1 Tax=Phyllachora maydis TaxID=1825666 RepID=A0AAD9HVE7_9PEZI|nr:hypothetical protein P8C59_000208 [Phyllachora maydis]
MPAKITPAIRCAAIYKRKQEEIAQAYATAAKAAAAKGRNKDDTYNRAYKPPANVEEEKGNKDDGKREEKEDDSNDNSTSDGIGNSKDKARYKPSDSSLYYKAYADIYVYYI